MSLTIEDPQILVYEDVGVSPSSADALVAQLKKLIDSSISVLKVDSTYLKEQPWEKKTALLVLGGGICSLWEKNLGEEGTAKIHRYVVE